MSVSFTITALGPNALSNSGFHELSSLIHAVMLVRAVPTSHLFADRCLRVQFNSSRMDHVHPLFIRTTHFISSVLRNLYFPFYAAFGQRF